MINNENANDSVLLLFQYSDLELAINTLATEFHKAADDGPTMNTTQFQTMISKQMPAIAKVLMTSQLIFQSQIRCHKSVVFMFGSLGCYKETSSTF